MGRESGKLTGADAWYVKDDRIGLREYYLGANKATANETAENLKKQSDMIKEARLLGVRPINIERLLAYLGYDFAAPIRGRSEAIDTGAQRRLLAPQQNQNRPKAVDPGSTESKPGDTTPN